MEFNSNKIQALLFACVAIIVGTILHLVLYKASPCSVLRIGKG